MNGEFSHLIKGITTHFLKKTCPLVWAILICLAAGNPQNLEAQCNGTNLIQNGGFEAPNVYPPDPPYLEALTGSDLPGWEITAGNIDVIDEALAPGVGTDWANSGDQSIDLNGMNAPGAVRQTISTNQGDIYLLSFFLSTNDECTNDPPRPNNAVVVLIDGVIHGFFDSPENGMWDEFQVYFTAGYGSTTIEFISNIQFEGFDFQNNGLNPSGCGALLDDVSVFQCPPETDVPENVDCFIEFGENLISNYSFEEDDASANPFYIQIPSDQLGLQGWQVSGQLDIINQNFPQAPNSWSSHGNQGIDMNGDTGPGSIYQIIETKPGYVYEVSWSASSNIFCSNPRHGLMQSLTLEVDDVPIDTYDTPTNPTWLRYHAKFQADNSGTSKIEFISEIASGGCGPMLDEVIVRVCGGADNPIPTLSQWALICLGLILSIVGVVGLKRRFVTGRFS